MAPHSSWDRVPHSDSANEPPKCRAPLAFLDRHDSGVDFRWELTRDARKQAYGWFWQLRTVVRIAHMASVPACAARTAMEWRTRSRKGRVAAGPRVPRRERRPPCPLRRASASNAGAHARRPQTLTMCHDRRATSELGQQTMRTPTAGRPCIMTGTGRSGGTLSPGRPGLCPCQPEAACARGPWQERPRPQEQGRRTCGTERVISPAPLPAFSLAGRCGVSPLEGVHDLGSDRVGSGPGHRSEAIEQASG
jgi:hypothetical protein